MESLEKLLFPKTFNRFSYVANVFWIFLQGILFGIFLDIEINESRLDFVCGSNDDSEELIRGRGAGNSMKKKQQQIRNSYVWFPHC